MSVFKTSGIVLKVKKINEKESIYTVLFLDYGVLTVQKKKKVREKSLDTGYLINCEIITKGHNNIHTIGNIKIISQFVHEGKSYKEIEIFLRIVAYTLQQIPTGIQYYEVYIIFEHILKHSKTITCTHLILSYIKIRCILGNMGEVHADKTVQKIVVFLRKEKIETCLNLRGINDEILSKLEILVHKN